jgi:hypothetical protein
MSGRKSKAPSIMRWRFPIIDDVKIGLAEDVEHTSLKTDDVEYVRKDLFDSFLLRLEGVVREMVVERVNGDGAYLAGMREGRDWAVRKIHTVFPELKDDK